MLVYKFHCYNNNPTSSIIRTNTLSQIFTKEGFLGTLDYRTNHEPILYLPHFSRLITSNRDVQPDRAVFLDRDGTIVDDVGYLTSLSDLKILEGAIEGLRLLRDHFLILLVTNQSAVGQGLINVTELMDIHQTLAEQLQAKGAGVDAIYSCPHIPEAECNCRKPRPGMILSAQAKFSIDLDHSVLVGDKLSDIAAGQGAKIPVTILVKSLKTDMINLQNVHPTCVVDNLFEASQYVLNQLSLGN